MSTIVSDSKPLPAPNAGPIRCTSWCEEGDGHARALFAADQWCHSVDAKLVVSLEPATRWVSPFEGIDGERPAEARVYAAKDVGEAPLVTLVTHEDQGMNLTPSEARELAGLLRHFAWVAEQDGRERNAFELGMDAERLGVPHRF